MPIAIRAPRVIEEESVMANTMIVVIRGGVHIATAYMATWIAMVIKLTYAVAMTAMIMIPTDTPEMSRYVMPQTQAMTRTAIHQRWLRRTWIQKAIRITMDILI